MKSTSELTKQMNAYASQFIQQVFPIRIQSKQDMLMLEEDDNVLENFGPYEDEEFIMKKQEIEGDQRDLVGKSLDTRSRAKDGLSGHTPQAELFANELSSFLKEVRFGEQMFPTSKPILDIKYYQLAFQNDNLFYLFNDQ